MSTVPSGNRGTSNIFPLPSSIMSDISEAIQQKCLAFGERIIKLNDYLIKEAAKFEKTEAATDEAPSFLDMQGILKGNGNAVIDRQLLDEYLQEKYGV